MSSFVFICPLLNWQMREKFLVQSQIDLLLIPAVHVSFIFSCKNIHVQMCQVCFKCPCALCRTRPLHTWCFNPVANFRIKMTSTIRIGVSVTIYFALWTGGKKLTCIISYDIDTCPYRYLWFCFKNFLLHQFKLETVVDFKAQRTVWLYTTWSGLHPTVSCIVVNISYWVRLGYFADLRVTAGMWSLG